MRLFNYLRRNGYRLIGDDEFIPVDDKFEKKSMAEKIKIETLRKL